MSNQEVFTKENRVRLIYFLGDVLEKPRHHNCGGYTGGTEYHALDELLRRYLGRLELAPYQVGYESINSFVQAAPESELLDLIEMLPFAKVNGRARDSYRAQVMTTEVENLRKKINWFLGSIVPGLDREQRFNRDGFEARETGPLAGLPKYQELREDLDQLLAGRELFSCVLLDLEQV